MQSDPQDEQAPTSDGQGAVPPDATGGQAPPPPTDPAPEQDPPAAGDQPAPSASAADPAQPAPPLMPSPRDPAAAPASTAPPPPQMPEASGGPETAEAAGATGVATDEPAGAEVAPAPPAAGDVDLLDRICPYLLSEDGSYRSAQPDDGHRCTAQDPPGTLPLAFQERFCLTDRHVRCEMYKYAQSSRAAELGGEGIPEEQVKRARFKPSVRSIPLAVGPSSGSSDEGGAQRRAIIIAAGLGAIAIIVAITLLLVGGGDGDDPGVATDASPSVEPQATQPATEPTPQPTPEPTPQPTPEPGATSRPSAEPESARQNILYEVQEGEALLKIAENFGTSRFRIIQANEGMEDKKPYVEPGDVIIVPASQAITVEELEAYPGYQGPAE